MSALIPVSQKRPSQELAVILDEHQKEGDRLSFDLRDWGTDLLWDVVRFRKQEVVDETAWKRVLVEKTDTFRHLIWDPFSDRPMGKLVFDGRQPWDEEIYNDCRDCCIVSPFDGQEMPENPKKHVFGNDVSHWVRLYMPDRSKESEREVRPMLALAKYPELNAVKKSIYQRVAQGVVAKEKLKAVLQEIAEFRASMEKAVNRMRYEAKAAIEEAEKGFQNSDELLVSRIESVEKVYQEALSDFEKQKEWRNRIFQGKIAQLETEMKIRDETDQPAIENLQKQKEALVAEREREFASYSEQFDSVDRTRIQVLQSLNAQMKSGHEQWKKEAAVKQQQHRAKVSGASAEISQVGQRARQLEQEIAQTRARAQELDRQTEQQVHRLHDLRIALDNVSDQLGNLPSRSGTRLFGINF